MEQVLEGSLEPGNFSRGDKAFFIVALHDFVGNNALHGLTKNALGFSLERNLGFVGGRKGKLYEAMVQKGYSTLNAKGHRIAVVVVQNGRQRRGGHQVVQEGIEVVAAVGGQAERNGIRSVGQDMTKHLTALDLVNFLGSAQNQGRLCGHHEALA